MNSAWAIRLAREDAATLGILRLSPGVEIAEEGPMLWLRGRRGDDLLHSVLLSLPAIQRFVWLEDDQLRPLEGRIPSRKLPPGDWLPLDRWMTVTLPPAGFVSGSPGAIALRLVRGGTEETPSLLLTTLELWADYASNAPEIRLKSLQFAADARGRALIRGRPLPPVEGCQWVERSGIAIPAGFQWTPAVSVEVLVRRLSVLSRTIALWHEDGTVERIHSEQFVPATRANIRATLDTGAVAP